MPADDRTGMTPFTRRSLLAGAATAGAAAVSADWWHAEGAWAAPVEQQTSCVSSPLLVINVMDYYQGGADYSDAFISALACPGELYVPAGTYGFAKSVTFTSVTRFAVGAVLRPAAKDANLNDVVLKLGAIRAPNTKIFDVSLGGKIRLAAGAMDFLRTEWWGAKWNSTDTDDSGDALRAAFAACLDMAGEQAFMLPSGLCRFTGPVQVYRSTSVRGPGKPACIFRPASADAKLYFYGGPDDAGNVSRGETGGFSIDGLDIPAVGLQIQRGSDMLFQDIRVSGCKTNGVIQELQNSTFVGCDFLGGGTVSATDTSLVIDQTSQNLAFYGGTIKDAKVACLYITQSTATAPDGTEASEQRPEQIRFHGATIERAGTMGSPILIDAGVDIGFHRCAFSGGPSNSAPRVKLRRRALPTDPAHANRVQVGFYDCNGNMGTTSKLIDAVGRDVTGPPGPTEWNPDGTLWVDDPSGPSIDLRLEGPASINVLSSLLTPRAAVFVDDATQVSVGDAIRTTLPDIPLLYAQNATKSLAEITHYTSGIREIRRYFPGTLAIGSYGTSFHEHLRGQFELLWVSLSIVTPPGGNPVAVVLYKNDVRVFGPNDRPMLAAGVSEIIALPAIPTFYEYNDTLTIVVATVGVNPPGSDLVATVTLREVP